MIEIARGASPLVLGLPHTGTGLPDDTGRGLNRSGRALADTDWNIHRLYSGLVDGVTTVRTPVHRYVIDVNRDPAGESLYPGRTTTGLCPTTGFDGNPIHRDGAIPDAAETARRIAAYHRPYHAALEAEIDRVRHLHGHAVLYDCHSIRSKLPLLFEGVLPDFNIGTDNGKTCDPEIESAVAALCANAEGYTCVLNGRFRGGWTTRAHGRPAEGVHAIQMELAQSTYMDEAPPWTCRTNRARGLRGHLARILATLRDWRPR